MKLTKKNTFPIVSLLFLIVLIKSAWLSDDAFLTMRTVDNFINGYGLRWNILERVQIYTHPLWMFFLAGIYYFARNPVVTLYIASFTATLLALYLFSKFFTDTPEKLIWGITIFLFSKSFIDYSTSGLENPLTHFLMLVFLIIFFQEESISSKKIFLLYFIGALIASNRMDTFLIIMPALIYALYQTRSIKNIFYASLGFLPFVLWELFSLVYYGFPFPNTAYAKLTTGIDKILLIQHGFYYIKDSLIRDPVTLLTVFTGIILSFLKKQARETTLAIGLFLYVIYVIQIGGDFMSGRFFSVLLMIAVILIIRSRIHVSISTRNNVLAYAIFLIGLFSIYIAAPTKIEGDKQNGIADEKSVYYAATSILSLDIANIKPNYYWAENGIRDKLTLKKKTIRPTSGMYSFYAGPELHVVDTHGLGDPLLSRLHPIEQDDFRIGHFFREVPDGYWKFDRSFGNQITDPSLHQYYEKLSVLIHDENLMSPERLILIWRMNTGYYDYLLDAYSENISSQ